jgi:endonuclease-3
MNPARRSALFAALASANPEPKSDLVYTSTFELLVAVVLSAQATDRSVNLATARLFAGARTPAAILALGVEGLEAHIRTIGLFRSKARNVIALCQQLLELHGGEVPGSRTALEALPGVGRKTANVVLNIAFGEPSIAVDTHVFRVANRTGLAPGRNVREVEDGLLTAVPRQYLQHAHHWLILQGRYVCKARTPECWRCAITRQCGFSDKTPDPGTAATAAPAKKRVGPLSDSGRAKKATPRKRAAKKLPPRKPASPKPASRKGSRRV